jgi:hypothetical protein
MRTTTLLPWLCLAVACTKVEPKAPDVPEPADLLLVVSAASPKAVLENMAAYANAVKPGAGAGLDEAAFLKVLASPPGAPELQGLDLGKPLHFLLLDPKAHPKPVVLVAGVADEAKLKAITGASVRIHNGVALIGDEPAVAVVADHAFWLAGRPAPSSPTLSLAPGKLVARYRQEIADFRNQMGQIMAQQAPGMAKVLEVEIDLFLKLADQTDRLTVLVDATAADAWFELGLAPKAGTMFAGFVAAQKPGIDPSLLELLPAVEKPTMVMVGRMDLGPARAPMLEIAFSMFEQAAGRKLEPAERERWNAMLDNLDGRLAAVSWATESGMFQMHELLGASDGARAAAFARELFPASVSKPFEVMGMKMSAEVKPEAATHDGVIISEYRVAFDFSALPEMQREMMTKMYGPDGLKMQGRRFRQALRRRPGAGRHGLAAQAHRRRARRGTKTRRQRRSPPP